MSDYFFNIKNNLKLYISFINGSIIQTLETLKPLIKLPYRRDKINIILVPGLFCTSSVMNRLAKKLYDKNFNVICPPDFPNYFSFLANTCPIKDSAIIFKKFLQNLYLNQNIKNVYIIGHSNGGLIPALALDLALNEKNLIIPSMIKGIISMGTPFFGSPIANLIKIFVPQARDITIQSEILKTIQKYKHIYIAHFISTFDAVVPQNSQYYEGNLTIKFENFQHMDFIVGSTDKINLTAETIENIVNRVENERNFITV